VFAHGHWPRAEVRSRDRRLRQRRGLAYVNAVEYVRRERKLLMRVAQVSKPNGPFELVERELPEPGPNDVRVAVEACGVCHSDVLVKTGGLPGMTFPRVPGHEVSVASEPSCM
jgi:hypothetical protein